MAVRDHKLILIMTNVTSTVPKASVLGPVLFFYIIQIISPTKFNLTISAHQNATYSQLLTILNLANSAHLPGKFSPICRHNPVSLSLDSKHIQSRASKSAKTLGLLKRTLYPAKLKVKEAAYNMLVILKVE